MKFKNVKITWKSIVGLATLVGGIITQAISANVLPAGVSKFLIAVGGAVIAFERIADAIDYRSDSQFNSELGIPPTAKSVTPPVNTASPS